MDLEKRRSKLMQMGVSPSEMYIFSTPDPNRKLLIVKRTGIEKMEKLFNIRYKYISVTESSYGNGCNVTVVLQGETDNGQAIQAMGSANPDTTMNAFVSDVANKRARHKIVLKVADLYQYDVHSEDESDDFRPAKQKDSAAAYSEAVRKIKI